jgi:hypothetical protein
MDIATALHHLADRLNREPNRTTDLHRVRGWARALGLTADWLAWLPAPGGATQSEYATRLRRLAGEAR